MRLTSATLVFALMTSTGGFAQPESSLTATASLAPSTGRIGEPFTLSVVVGPRVGTADVRVVVGSALGPFEVVDVTRRAAGDGSDGREGWSISLVTFEHGRLAVPSVVVESRDALGRRITAETAPVAVEVDAPSALASDPLRPLTSVMGLPPDATRRLLTLLRWSLLVLGAGLAGGVLYERVRPWRSQRAFWRRLVADGMDLTTSAGSVPVRDQYMRAACLLRLGVSSICERRVDPLTSHELVVLVGQAGRVGAEIGPALSLLLAHLDRVRFGGVRPSDETRRRASRAVVTLLHALSAIAARQKRFVACPR